MSTGQPVLSPDHFAKVLRPFRRRSWMITTARTVLWGMLAILAAVLLVMWVDLIWALPEAARWWTTRGGLAAAVAAVAAWSVMLVLRTDNDSLARRIDDAKRTGGEILTGWQLSSRPVHPEDATSRGLAALAAERARSLAASFAPPEVFPVDKVRQAGMALLCAGVGVSLLAALIPGIATHQLHRFLHPSADVPPFTGVSIELELETNPVLYGDDVLVTATTSSRSLERLQLVTRTDDGTENVMPMLPTGAADSDAESYRWQSLLTRVTEPLNLHARSGRSRSRYRQLDVQMTPQILPPVVRVTPPQYTGGGTYEGPIPSDGLNGLAGTVVQWRVQSNRPLSEGLVRLQYRDGPRHQVSLRPAEETGSVEAGPATTVVGAMELTQPGRFEVSVVDTDGVESQQTIQGSIAILADQRPVIRIVSPRQRSLATPDISLPVSIAAEDDYGITSVSLYRSLNGSPARAIDFEVEQDARQNVKLELPLHRYGVEAGDEIQLFARAEDNDPEGPKGAESPVTTIRIISVQQFQETMLARRGAESLRAKYQAAQRHLESVAEEIRRLEKAAERADADPESAEKRQELHEKLGSARQAAAEASEAIQRLSEQAMPIDVDQELARRLSEMGRNVKEMAEQMKDMTGRDGASQQPLSDPERERLRQMVQQLSSDRQQLQRQAVEPMQRMQQILPLVADQQRFTQIARQQRDLQRRLDSLRTKAGEDMPKLQRRVAELENEQEQLRRALDQLLDDIRQHAKALPEDPELDQLKETALEFTAAVRDSDAIEEMAGAQQQLSQSQFTRAEASADSAADTLESFLSQCNGMGNQASGSCKAAFRPGAGGPQLGNSLQQMLQMLGMKPGASGTRPGGAPGMGIGYGAGGGYAQRTPGPENVGLYGSVPGATDSPSRGRGDRASGGVATNSPGAADTGTDSGVDFQQSGSASGQADQSVPPQYRSQVTEYFRKLAEGMGQ